MWPNICLLRFYCMLGILLGYSVLCCYATFLLRFYFKLGLMLGYSELCFYATWLLRFYLMLRFITGCFELCCYATCLLRCSAVYQRSSVQVLTKFKAHDLEGGITHLMGSSDWCCRVSLSGPDTLVSEQRSVARGAGGRFTQETLLRARV